MSSFVFCRVFIVLVDFRLHCVTDHCNSLHVHKKKSRLVIAIWQGSWTSRTKNRFISWKFESAATFSAPAQEGNLLFLSALSARKKLHSFPSKSNHLQLCRTLGPTQPVPGAQIVERERKIKRAKELHYLNAWNRLGPTRLSSQACDRLCAYQLICI